MRDNKNSYEHALLYSHQSGWMIDSNINVQARLLQLSLDGEIIPSEELEEFFKKVEAFLKPHEKSNKVKSKKKKK